MSQRPTYQGEPTLAQVMRRPRWILALLLALIVAALFAGLAQWQMDHAIHLQTEEESQTETPTPLSEYTSALTPVTEESAGHVVMFDGTVVHPDTRIIGNRVNDGSIGYWVVVHVVTDLRDTGHEHGHIAVAIGWAETVEAAEEAATTLGEALPVDERHMFTGRYTPSEGPELPRPSTAFPELQSLATAELINLWEPFEGAPYSGFVVSHDPYPGLELIDSVPPLPQETINWLNLFYAVEWMVFGGFAIFFWYRLARDAWEKEHERQLLDEVREHSPAT